MPTRLLIAVAFCALLTLSETTWAQGRGGGKGRGHGGHPGGFGGHHGGFAPPAPLFRGSVQGTINRFLSGGNLGYGGYHYKVYPPRIRYYGFTIGLPYAFAYQDGYYPGYYSYLYGPYPAGGPPIVGQPYPVGPDYIAGDYSTAPGPTPAMADEPGGNIDSSLAAAKTAFRLQRYRDAIVSAGKAAEARPDDPAPHELLSQAMFALGDYRGAAIEAHAVIHFGEPADWANVNRLYADPATYSRHLRALEAHATAHRDDAASAFLLGYHYKMLGHDDNAAAWLAQAIELAPDDAQAKKLLDPTAGGQPQVEIATKAAPESSPKPASVLVPASTRLRTAEPQMLEELGPPPPDQQPPQAITPQNPAPAPLPPIRSVLVPKDAAAPAPASAPSETLPLAAPAN